MDSLELAESEILKTMPAGAIVVEKKSGKIVFVNDRFIELMGFNPKGSSFKEYALNMVRARKLEGGPYLFEQLPLTKALLNGEVSATQEMVLQKPDKTDRTVRVNAKPLSNDKGEIIGAIATFEDITDRNKAEQALRESEEEYRSLFDNMADGLACCQIIFSDENKPIDFVYLKVNDAFEKITGLKRETVVGKKVNEAIPGTKEAHPELIELYGRVALTGKSENFEILFKPLALWLHISAYSIEKGYFVAIFHDISERTKAEEALKESEERFLKAFSSNPVAVSISRLADGLLIDVNETYLQLFEFSRQEVINHTSTQINIFTRPTERAELVQLLHEKGTIRNLEVTFQTKTGKRINALLSVEKLGFKDQDYIISTFVDITERKKTEEALKESEERFSKAFRSSPAVLTITCVEDNKLVDVNESFLKLFEYTREEVIGHTTRELKLFQNLDERDRLVALALQKGGLRNQELIARTKIGKTLNVFFSLESIDIGGQKHVLSTIIDNTERKKAEEELKESEQLYRTLFENTDDAFQLLKPLYDEAGKPYDLLLLKVNKAYERQTGLKAVDVAGKTVKEYIPNVEPYWITVYGNVAKTGKSTHIENYNQSTNRWYDVYAFLYAKDQVGALFRDITERKKLEKQLKDSERLAAIGQTAGMVGHDIRNPLQAVLGDTYLLKEELAAMPECNSNEGVAESLDSIEKNVAYINKIVQDLQDYSRTITPEYSEVNLSNAFTSIFKIISLPDTIKLSISIKDSERLRIDPVLLQRALSNLVTNAIQAMPKGGNLEISGQPKENQIVITVKDTGTGIPEEVKPRLFTPMITTKAKGQGFGLAVSKRLIEAMKGTITFESEKGKGTTFTISLPLAPSKLSQNR